MTQKNGLKYTKENMIIPGIPARDLSHEEVLHFGGYDLLVTSGVFKYPPKKRTVKKSNKDGE